VLYAFAGGWAILFLLSGAAAVSLACSVDPFTCVAPAGISIACAFAAAYMFVLARVA
jgi:hypothetical protein